MPARAWKEASNQTGTEKTAGGEEKMLTFIWLAVVFILALVALFAYSSRNKKSRQPPQEITATDRAMNPDRKRATGGGDD